MGSKQSYKWNTKETLNFFFKENVDYKCEIDIFFLNQKIEREAKENTPGTLFF